ncbi:MAG: hypothetical protein R3B84_20405 [Zavarzinella sp.]
MGNNPQGSSIPDLLANICANSIVKSVQLKISGQQKQHLQQCIYHAVRAMLGEVFEFCGPYGPSSGPTTKEN